MLNIIRKNHLALIIIILALASCGKEEFSVNKATDGYKTKELKHYTSSYCSSFTLIKPKVDFLFLWDNSPSQRYVSNATRIALNNTIKLISNRFDFRILLAPLIGNDFDRYFFLWTENPQGLTDYAKQKMISDNPGSKLNLIMSTYTGSAREGGITRAIDIIGHYRQHNVFRQNAYLIIVLMSNGDDNTFLQNVGLNIASQELENGYLDNKMNELRNIRDNVLHNEQLRFISVVAHTKCYNTYKPGRVYMNMSSRVYSDPFPTGDPRKRPTDQGSRNYPDSYNICSISDFRHLFDGINNSIQATIIKHKYDFWLISDNINKPINTDAIKVTKVFPGKVKQNIPKKTSGTSNGFSYFKGTQNTRFSPTPGEPKTGHLIQLFGNSIVTYPECLVINTQDPTDYYGYIQLTNKPYPSSILLTINDIEIPESDSNGWQYVGYKKSQNIKIKSPSEPNTEGKPPDYRTGYFLKLHGSAIHSNGAKIEVMYDPMQ